MQLLDTLWRHETAKTSGQDVGDHRMWVTTLSILTTEILESHANAPPTPLGRTRLTVLIVEA
ncbi:hypothetical protein BG28_12895 [Nesterenkonia sp. AN1]|nr:hypothetical protein BG28_12895 [Nesterenkonia sp. AN1]